MQFLRNLDASLLLWIQEYLRFPLLTPFFQVLTALGNHGMIWIALSAALLCIPKYRKAGLASALSLIGCLLIVNLWLKNLVARTRPYEVIEGLEILIARPKDFSFPSGHTAAAFAASVSVCLNGHRREGGLCILLAFLIAFSRLYLGVHYPSDVLGGAAIGLAIAGAVAAALNTRKRALQKGSVK